MNLQIMKQDWCPLRTDIRLFLSRNVSYNRWMLNFRLRKYT